MGKFEKIQNRSDYERSTPRGRFLSAVDRKSPGKVSWDLGQGIASFTRAFYENMCDYLDVTDNTAPLTSRMLQIVQPNSYIQERVCGDLRVLGIGPPEDGDREIDEGSYEDEWGIIRRRSSNSYYYDIVSSPLSDCNDPMECLDQFKVPERPGKRTRGMSKIAKDYYERGYAVGAWCFPGIFEMVFWLRGYRNAYLDFARSPEIPATIMDKLLEINKKFWGKIIDELDGFLDVVILTEDLGTQSSLMISPSQFRDIVKPRLTELINFLKGRGEGLRVLLHSDGAVRPLISDFIDMGVDVLNPIQPKAKNMNHEELKESYGDRLSFHGGIDIQALLCNGDPREVERETKQKIQLLGEGGGYIVAPSHCVQPDVPPENILAMVDAVKSVGDYPDP